MGSVVGSVLVAIILAVGAVVVLRRRAPLKATKEEYEVEEFSGESTITSTT